MSGPVKGKLLDLAAQQRAAFLLLALPPAALRKACRRLGLSFPGYRLEKIPGADLARALAEEYDISPRVTRLIDEDLDDACRPSFLIPAGSLRPPLVGLMTWLAAAPPEAAVVPLLWQFFGHPVEKVRKAAASALDDYIRFLGDVMGTVQEDRRNSLPPAGAPDRSAVGGSRDGLRSRLKEAESRASALARGLEAQKALLLEERRQAALKEERLARVKEDLAESQVRLRASEEARSSLEVERDTDAAEAARRAAVEATRLARLVESLRADLSAARRREAELLTRLKADASPAHPPAPAAQERPREPPAAFAVPVLSPEFYDSIRGWELRMVRTAFEKILLLSQDFTHPGLDAKQMQGADGLYRIYVAQDVRLFYRRLPAGRIEILSLVDRENLDRYIRQYRTRADA